MMVHTLVLTVLLNNFLKVPVETCNYQVLSKCLPYDHNSKCSPAINIHSLNLSTFSKASRFFAQHIKPLRFHMVQTKTI